MEMSYKGLIGVHAEAVSGVSSGCGAGDLASQAIGSRGSCGTASAPVQEDQGEGCLYFDVFGWNVGGSSLDCLCDVVAQHAGRPLRDSDVFAVQEFPRRKEGWTTDKIDGLTHTSYRANGEWRGQGVVFNDRIWAVTKRVPGAKGVWVRMKHLRHDVAVWFGVFHFAPGCNQAEYSSELQSFFRKKPRDGHPIVVQGDANAPLKWSEQGSEVHAVGQDCKAVLLLDCLEEHGLAPCAPDGICPVDRGRKPGKAVTLTCLRRPGSCEEGLGFTWILALSLGRTTKCFKGRLDCEGSSPIADIAQPLVYGLVARPR